MDGHSSHMNLSVAEFCADHNIILYCLPPHSSHLLQPLDVSVFGPLKKSWNDSIEDFQVKFKTSMTKAHFFPVFDKAWKIATRKENAISGFEATGLVPFNPDRLDYSKLVSPDAIATWKKKSSQKSASAHEMLGVNRCLSIAKNFLTSHDCDVFDRRISEGYDIQDDSSYSKLYHIYKGIKEISTSSARDTDTGTPTEVDIRSPSVPSTHAAPLSAEAGISLAGPSNTRSSSVPSTPTVRGGQM